MTSKAKNQYQKPTGKQRQFAKLIAKGMPQADAYAQVYDVKPDTPRKSIVEMASRNAAKVKVASIVEEIKRPGIRILERAEEIAAQKLAELVTAEEEIVSTDGSVIGKKRNVEMNRRAANDVLEKLGYNGSEQKSVTNNNIIIVPREDVEEALRRLARSND